MQNWDSVMIVFCTRMNQSQLQFYTNNKTAATLHVILYDKSIDGSFWPVTCYLFSECNTGPATHTNYSVAWVPFSMNWDRTCFCEWLSEWVSECWLAPMLITLRTWPRGDYLGKLEDQIKYLTDKGGIRIRNLTCNLCVQSYMNYDTVSS